MKRGKNCCLVHGQLHVLCRVQIHAVPRAGEGGCVVVVVVVVVCMANVCCVCVGDAETERTSPQQMSFDLNSPDMTPGASPVIVDVWQAQ